MTTDVCIGASFWQVKADTRLLQIARWAMQACTTSGGSNPIRTRCSEWQFTRSGKQWAFAITSPSMRVKRILRDWKNCWKCHSMYSKSLSYLDTMTTPRINMSFSRVIKCTSRKEGWMCAALHRERLESTWGHSKAFFVHQGLEWFQASHLSTERCEE